LFGRKAGDRKFGEIAAGVASLKKGEQLAAHPSVLPNNETNKI